MTQGVQENSWRLPTIEPESHFVQVGGEMLCADTVPCSHNAALQETESGLDCVGMNVPLHVNAVFVPNGLVLFCRDSGSLHCEGVRRELIRNYHVYILADVLANELCHSARL